MGRGQVQLLDRPALESVRRGLSCAGD